MLTPCGDWAERLSAYLDGEGTPAEMAAVQEHLTQCPACRAAVELARCDAQDVHATLAARGAREGFAASVMAQVAATIPESSPDLEPAASSPSRYQELSFNKPRRRWSSIWEWLAVGTVTMVVASVLFPTFAKSREKARQTTCLSNLRQMGTALAIYIQDNKGYLPNAATWTTDIMGDGGVTTKMLECPQDTDEGGVDYAYNWKLSGLHSRDLSEPSAVVAFFDAKRGRPSYRHGGIIMAFCDGHAKYFPGKGDPNVPPDPYADGHVEGVCSPSADVSDGVFSRRPSVAESPKPQPSSMPPANRPMTDDALEAKSKALDVPLGRMDGKRDIKKGAKFSTPSIAPPARNYGLADKLQIAYQAALGLETGEVAGALEAAEGIIRRYEGFVLSSNFTRESEEREVATVSGRVPSEKLGETLVELGKLGTIVSRTVNGEDLTATHLEHVETLGDLAGAQGHLESLESRARRTGDALSVENRRDNAAREATGVRVKEYELQHKVTLAQVSVTITSPAPTAKVERPVNPLLHSLQASTKALGGFGQWLLAAVLIPLAVWLPVWGPVVGAVIYWRRRRGC
jgi:hypothetical protein